MRKFFGKNVIMFLRSGMALPLVVIFVALAAIFAASMFMFRKEVKQENVTNIHFLQANFLAQAAINHALMKIRTMPQEAYDAAVAQRGFCPFKAIISGTGGVNGPHTPTGDPMNTFISDCQSASVPWKIPDIAIADWKYSVASISVLSAFTDTANDDLVITVQIVGIGEMFDHKGGRGWRKEKMVKTVELRRKQQI